MKFNTNIFNLMHDPNVVIKLEGTSLPNNDGLFFRAKQKEMLDQYNAARIMLMATDNKEWLGYFETPNQETAEEMEWYLKAIAYESALMLMYYNIVVDLSWVLCYSAVEYVYAEENQKPVEIKGIQPIGEAYENMRKLEATTVNPTEKNNPYKYLKNRVPRFTVAIDQIMGFWKAYHESDIRQKYNFIKHRGKPLYDEIEVQKICNIYVESEGSLNKVASGLSDIQSRFSLITAIKKLKDFDENTLFPYISSLIKELERQVKPSRMID